MVMIRLCRLSLVGENWLGLVDYGWFQKKKKKSTEFSIDIAGWVLDDQVFHTLPYPPLTLKTIRVGIPRGVKGVS